MSIRSDKKKSSVKPKSRVIFPSTLLGTREKWTLMKSISVKEYLNYESGVLYIFYQKKAEQIKDLFYMPLVMTIQFVVKCGPNFLFLESLSFFGLLLSGSSRPSIYAQVIFDCRTAIKFNGMSEKAYNRSLNTMQNGLGIKNKLDIRELGIQFGCIRIIPLVQKGLSLYRDRFLAALLASRRASADFTRPVFTAVAFYLSAKRHKLKVEKIKLIELCGASESEFSSDLYYDKFGILKEKKDSKNVKGNRDLLDELPEKWRIEERGYLSDDGEEQSACYCSFYYCICLVMAFYFTYWCKFALVCIFFGLLILGWAVVAKGCCCSCWP